ncbi:MAG: DNA polymerase III subunit beta [Porticoccaceae bacterium]|nr:MAG: DNA polymerase III subunit beta [Porticoccaceae bacterium]
MKFTVVRESLLKPLQLAAGVVERRQTLPVLANVLLSLEPGELCITGTDLEVEIRGTLPLDGVVEVGQITVPARKLLDICRSLPDGAAITVSTDSENRVRIQSGRSRFTLATLPADDFPAVDREPGRIQFLVSQDRLKRLLDQTSFAMAQQDVRYYLNGMLWEITTGRLRVVATDGHRLALADAGVDVTSAERIQAILPRKGVQELARLLGDAADAHVVIGTNHVRVEGADYRLTTKLVDGAYPDYERVLPRNGNQIVEGDRETLRQAFYRAAILSNEKYRGVRLGLTQGTLTAVANNPEQERAEEEVSVDYEGDQLEVGFNVSYLLDVLNALPGSRVRFCLADANSSVLLTNPEDSDSAYVIMPMRL